MGIFNFLFGSHPPKSVSEQLVDMVSAPQAETEMYKVILSGKKTLQSHVMAHIYILRTYWIYRSIYRITKKDPVGTELYDSFRSALQKKLSSNADGQNMLKEYLSLVDETVITYSMLAREEKDGESYWPMGAFYILKGLEKQVRELLEEHYCSSNSGFIEGIHQYEATAPYKFGSSFYFDWKMFLLMDRARVYILAEKLLLDNMNNNFGGA